METRLKDNILQPDNRPQSPTGQNQPLSWKEFFGSSCDLAPALLSIYDNYGATSSEIDNDVTTPDKVTRQTDSPTNQPMVNSGTKDKNCQSSTLQSRHTRQKSRSCQNVNFKSEERFTVEINGNMQDTRDVQMKDMEDDTEDERTIEAVKDPNAGFNTNVAGCKVVVNDGMAACSHGSHGLQDGGPIPVGVAQHHLSESDAKKRPLSISSTSSSVSSSSLPRHQRKKVATNAILSTSQTNPDTRGEAGKVQCDSSNLSITGNVSSCCSCSPQKSSCQAVTGVCTHKQNNHSPPNGLEHTNIKTPCSSCRHSRMGFSEHFNHICDITEVNEFNTSDTLDSPSSQDLNRSLSDPGGGVAPPKSPSVSSTHSHRFMLDFGGSYLSRVVHEVLETERIYVADLRDIKQGYIGYLDSTCDLAIEQEDKKALFGNIGDIYDFNRDFLEHLEQCELDPVQVAQCFVERSEGFLIYTDYCTNYPRSMEVLTVIMHEKPLSDVFKKQQMNLHHALPLGSYLLKPVQRILKYHLFLQNMLNNFDKCRAGHEAVIAQALESMTNIAQHINEMKRQHERAVHIQEIQSMLFGWDKDDLTTYGELVLEDHFRVHGAKAHRLLYLFEKVLIIAKRKEDGNLLVKGSIKCSDLMLVESIPKEPLSFHVIPFSNPKMQFTVQAKNLDHKHKWCQEIKRLMIDNFQAVIPDKAKQLMMMLGKSKEEEDFDEKSAEEVGLSKKQHTAPEYLERRRHRRKSTSIIPDFGLLKNRRGRRQNEEGASPSRPHTATKTKDAGFGGGMFVSYLAQKPGDVMEEDEETEVLSEAPSSTRGSSKSSTLESKSLSLESLKDLDTTARPAVCVPPMSPKSPTRQRDAGYFMDLKDTDSDQINCKAARRASRVGSKDLLLTDDVIPSKHKTGPGSDGKSTAYREDSPLQRGESYRKAYELNRIDSVKLAQRQYSKDSNHDDSCVQQDAVENLDDGYVGVVFDDRGVTLPIVGESSTDDPDYVRITLPECGESSTDPVKKSSEKFELVSHAQVIVNSRTEQIEKSNCTRSGLVSKGAIALVNNKQRGASLVFQNSMAMDSVANQSLSSSTGEDECKENQEEPSVSHCAKYQVNPEKWTSPYCGNSLQYSGHCDNPAKLTTDSQLLPRSPMEHVLANSYITSTPVTVNTCVNVHSQPLHHMAMSGSCEPGLSSSVYSISNLASPVRLSSDLKNGMSQSKLEVCHPMDVSDPWILRADTLRPCNSANCRKKKLSQPVFRQHSLSAMDTKNRIQQKKRINKLYRSNSCASLDENICGSSPEKSNNKPCSSHKRVSSDTSTLVFANKSAFLTSECPHKIKYSPEIQRTVARLGTPPREMGPDHLLEEIEECRSKGKVVTRYATPPREIMDPALMNKGTVFENNYTCALEKEILENIRQDVQDSSITMNDAKTIPTSKSSSRFLPNIVKLLKPVNSNPPSPVICNRSETISHNKDMWDELQKCENKSRTEPTSVQTKSPIIRGSTLLLSSPSSRPGSFHGGASHICVNPLAHSTPSSQTPVSCSSSTVLSNNDSFVDSLRNAVISLTSKITRRNPRSVEASPVRVTRRARSLGAEEDARIKPVKDCVVATAMQQKPPKSVRENCNKERKKEVKRNRFVFHLARAYSERIKKNRIDGDTMKGLPSSYMQTGSKLSVAAIDVPSVDAKTIGERMAHSRPNILGTYTLTQHRIRKQKLAEADMEIQVESELESVESSSGEGGNFQHDDSLNSSKKVATDLRMPQMPFLSSDAMDTNYGGSESDVTEEPSSLDCFYERQFNDAIGQLEEGCRDSAIYSDDGAAITSNNAESDLMTVSNSSSGKISLVTRQSSLRSSGKKTDVKPSEKSQAVKNIVKNLEAASNGSKSPPVSPVTEPVLSLTRKHSNSVQMNLEDMRSVKMSPSSFKRQRSRELHEVAMFSRIRQNSFDDLDEGRNIEDTDSILCDRKEEEHVHDRCEETSEEDLTKPKIGWVKQVVSQIQGASVCS